MQNEPSITTEGDTIQRKNLMIIEKQKQQKREIGIRDNIVVPDSFGIPLKRAI